MNNIMTNPEFSPFTQQLGINKSKRKQLTITMPQITNIYFLPPLATRTIAATWNMLLNQSSFVSGCS